jgi:F0F1-type ATP synthase assembly protein I
MGFVYGGTMYLCPNCFASVVATTAEGQKPLGGTIAGA